MGENSAIYQLKITLEGIVPPVWRRVHVSSENTFANLHDIIQMAMGWDNCHLYQFCFKKMVLKPQYDGSPDMFGAPNERDDSEIMLSEMFQAEKKCSYTYDFGDDWRHTVQLEKVLDADPGKLYPICTGGARACPPEDCGGTLGYASLLAILADPSHPEHEERREWLSDLTLDDDAEWDAEHFDSDEANEELEELRELYSMEEDPLPPTLPQWRRLYEIAGRVKDAKPWEKLCDADYIAVQPKVRGEPVFYSTMGTLGECMAVAAYPGYVAIAGLERMRERLMAGASFAAAGTQDCVICYFGNREELEKEDRDVLKELGIKFRGKGQWIYFRSMKPGYAPWHISAAEADILCETMEQYLAAYKEYAGGKCDIDFAEREVLLRQFEPTPKPGGWISLRTYLASPVYDGKSAEITDELYIARLKRKKKSPLELELDILYLPTPVQERKGLRPYFPRLALLVERHDGMILNQKLMPPRENAESEIFDMLRELVENHGRPRSIRVRDGEIAAIVEDWCKKLGVELEVGYPLPLIDDALESMMAFMGFDDA